MAPPQRQATRLRSSCYAVAPAKTPPRLPPRLPPRTTPAVAEACRASRAAATSKMQHPVETGMATSTLLVRAATPAGLDAKTVPALSRFSLIAILQYHDPPPIKKQDVRSSPYVQAAGCLESAAEDGCSCMQLQCTAGCRCAADGGWRRCFSKLPTRCVGQLLGLATRQCEGTRRLLAQVVAWSAMVGLHPVSDPLRGKMQEEVLEKRCGTNLATWTRVVCPLPQALRIQHHESVCRSIGVAVIHLHPPLLSDTRVLENVYVYAYLCLGAGLYWYCMVLHTRDCIDRGLVCSCFLKSFNLEKNPVRLLAQVVAGPDVGSSPGKGVEQTLELRVVCCSVPASTSTADSTP